MKNNDSVYSSVEIRNPDEAFENAISKGLKNPEDYMYMYSTNDSDYFKHIDTREYTHYGIDF